MGLASRKVETICGRDFSSALHFVKFSIESDVQLKDFDFDSDILYCCPHDACYIHLVYSLVILMLTLTDHAWKISMRFP